MVAMASFKVTWTQGRKGGAQTRHGTTVKAASMAEAKAIVRQRLPFSNDVQYKNFVATRVGR